MSTISVITPVRSGNAPYLEEAWASIAAQPLPPGCELEWVLQEDSEIPTHRAWAERDPRVRYGYNGVRQGAAGTRNLALARARGQFFRNLDDDEVAPGSLLAALSVAVTCPEVDYVVGPALDRVGDELEAVARDLPPGPIAPFTLFDHWKQHDHHGIVHPSGLFARRAKVLALGGFPALAGSEDTALLMVLSTKCLGWQLAEPVLHYRRHPRQTITAAWSVNPHTRAQRHLAIEQFVAHASAESLAFCGDASEAPVRSATAAWTGAEPSRGRRVPSR